MTAPDPVTHWVHPVEDEYAAACREVFGPGGLVDQHAALPERWTESVQGDAEVDREPWLAQRRRYANASSISAMFGDHRYRSLWEVATAYWRPELDSIDPDMAERGHLLEPAMIEWARRHELAGMTVEKPRQLWVCGRLAASPDAEAHPGDAFGIPTFGVECKSLRGFFDPEQPVRADWWWQIQSGFACTGWDRWLLIVLDSTLTFKSVWVDPSPAHMAAAVEAAGVLMDHVDLGMVPEPLAGPVVPRPTPKERAEVDRGLFAAWQQSRHEADNYTSQAKSLRDEIGTAAGTAQLLCIDGQPVARVSVRTLKTGEPSWSLTDLTKGDAA